MTLYDFLNFLYNNCLSFAQIIFILNMIIMFIFNYVFWWLTYTIEKVLFSLHQINNISILIQLKFITLEWMQKPVNYYWNKYVCWVKNKENNFRHFTHYSPWRCLLVNLRPWQSTSTEDKRLSLWRLSERSHPPRSIQRSSSRWC